MSIALTLVLYYHQMKNVLNHCYIECNNLIEEAYYPMCKKLMKLEY